MKLAKLNGKPEIFFSIQGEGKNIGRPSIFIRTSLCNLHCIWCDTDYTWNWQGTPFQHENDSKPGYEKFAKDKHIADLPIEEISELTRGFDCKNIVLTGGEPLLQQRELVQLITALRKIDKDYWFEIETNGTILPVADLNDIIDQYNVSPKLENSNNSKKLREKPEVYQYFTTNSKAIFKYVVSRPEDLEEIIFLAKKYDIGVQKTYLMPEGTSPEQLNEKQQWLVEQCKSMGFNYTDRLHIHIYGNKRGV